MLLFLKTIYKLFSKILIAVSVYNRRIHLYSFIKKSMLNLKKIIATIGCLTITLFCIAQKNVESKDINDVLRYVFKRKDTTAKKIKPISKYQLSVLPALGYSWQTGFSVVVTSNIAFKTSNLPNQKTSSINAGLTYSQYNQIIAPLTINYWTKNNKLNIITDFRLLNYPDFVFGVGTTAQPKKEFVIALTQLKLHQSVLKEVAKNTYIGASLQYDQFWNLNGLDSAIDNLPVAMQKKTGNNEVAVGLGLRFLYDSRLNQVNAQQGIYNNIILRNNFASLGSDANWASIITDTRLFTPFPKKSKNVLAFWLYNWVNLNSGIPSYLLLPSNGWDDNHNTARGYLQGRFKGTSLHYAETEYRFTITKNGLIGGVAFVNAQKYNQELFYRKNDIKFGYGAGLRIKFNKHSNANVCIDYGFGQDGSRGFFVNMGEVF